ncbi:MAG: phospholipase D-like domain-containing protein [Candidatus Hermodarchaeota archaeon]|nr:phospholipase D-like domain-containing protein [Candidatus Hermodarchaeota archaeon]
MRLKRLQTLMMFSLIGFMVFSFAIPLPRTSINVYAQPPLDKPATTFTGTATVNAFSSPDSSFLVLSDLLERTENEMQIMVYALTNWFLIEAIHDALVRNGSMEITIIVSWKWASAAERSLTKGAFYNLSQNAAFGSNLQLFYSEDTDLEFTHAKFMIFDGEYLVVESANWAKSGIPPASSAGNREWGVVIQQPDVVNYFMETFVHDLTLDNVEPYIPDIADEEEFSDNITTGSYPAPFENQTFTGSMSIQCVLSPDNDIPTIVALIDSATTTLEVQQMYSKMEWDGNPNQFNDAIIAAAQRGVTCRVMLDNRSSGMQEVGEMLLANGVQVRFSNQSYFGWTHNKGVIVDGNKVLVSSINWSFESTHENREAGVIITHSGVANYFTQIFDWDWDVGVSLGPPSEPTPIPMEYIIIGAAITVIIIVASFIWNWYKKRK